jgi:hypothetical protein
MQMQQGQGQRNQQPYPFSSSEHHTTERQTFPVACQGSHWDPTKVLRWTLPQQQIELPQDPRPWTKVCLTYTTTTPLEAAPSVPDSVVFPSGGAIYPPNRYANAIDEESLLRRLDRPLGTCEADEYTPSRDSTMFRAASTVPRKQTPATTQFVQELAMPRVLLRTGPYQCREEQDIVNLQRSQNLFHNATKYDKYGPDQRKPPPLTPHNLLS